MNLHHRGVRLRLYLTEDYKLANPYRDDARQQQHYSRAIHDFYSPKKVGNGCTRILLQRKMGGNTFPPVKHLLSESLELEASSQSHGERQVETRRQINDRRLQEVGVVFAEIELSELIRQTQTTIVCDVEKVSNEADACTLID